MQVKFIEAHNNEQNWGKFLVLRFDTELEYQSQISGVSLLRSIGWNPQALFVIDLQTGEGARFVPGGYAKGDLDKKSIWCCPLYEPFLEWLYIQDLSDLTKLPAVVNLPSAPFQYRGYRRPGLTGKGET